MRKTVVAALALSLLAIPSVSEAAAPKAGTTCRPAGKTVTLSGSRYVCTRIGKKLVWRQAAKSAPAPAAPDLPTVPPTPSAPTPPSGPAWVFLTQQYRAVDGLLERRFGGDYFRTDVRTAADFDPVRVIAYQQINALRTGNSHPHITINYWISPSLPKPLAQYSVAQLESAASLWDAVLDEPLFIEAVFATEKDVDYVRSRPNMLRGFAPQLEQLKLRDPLKDGAWQYAGGHYWRRGNQMSGLLYIGAPSWTDTERLDVLWPATVSHEFVHIVQDALAKGIRAPGEAAHEVATTLNLIEGSATTLSMLSAYGNLGWGSDAMDSRSRQILRDSASWHPVRSQADIPSLLIKTETRVSDQAFQMSYNAGALLYEWVIATYGIEKLLQLLRELPRHSVFAESTQEVLGMTPLQLYQDAAKYIWDNAMRTA